MVYSSTRGSVALKPSCPFASRLRLEYNADETSNVAVPFSAFMSTGLLYATLMSNLLLG